MQCCKFGKRWNWSCSLTLCFVISPSLFLAISKINFGQFRHFRNRHFGDLRNRKTAISRFDARPAGSRNRDFTNGHFTILLFRKSPFRKTFMFCILLCLKVHCLQVCVVVIRDKHFLLSRVLPQFGMSEVGFKLVVSEVGVWSWNVRSWSCSVEVGFLFWRFILYVISCMW